MKKFYVLIVVIICSAAQGFSQTYLWTGAASNGLWNDPNNWSVGGSVPNLNTHDVVFNAAADVTLASDIIVKSITINGANNVRIKGTAAFEVITVTSGNATAPAITVQETTGTLRLYSLSMNLAGNLLGTINGTLLLEGNSLDYAEVVFPETAGTIAFNINGTLSDLYGSSLLIALDDQLKFNAGSKLLLPGDAANIYMGVYDPGSEIVISGAPTSISFNENDAVGTITYNSSTQSQEVFLNIPSSGMVIGGSLNILNTNNRTLVLISNIEQQNGQLNYQFTVNGNLNISNTSTVALSNVIASIDLTNIYSGTINGSFNMGGTSFSLQNTVLTPTLATTLFVKGNINHTAGVITAVSAATSNTTGLFSIDMNGAAAQTINSISQSFNNAGNQVQLKISNPSGVTLETPLNVGKLAFSANGRLNTDDINFVKVMNPLPASVSGSGYVVGPVRRATNVASEYIFPTGSAGNAQYVSVYPTSITATTFEATYSPSNTDNTNITTPLTAITNYNWEIDRISAGANAQVEITLPVAVSGTTDADALIVAKSSGNDDWVDARGTAGTFAVGTAPAGTKIKSDIQTSFSRFTFGIIPMSAALPINLLSFTVNKSGAKANLNWKVTGNSTPQSFDVMKSSDGINFSKIGTVSGLSTKLSYNFTDNNLSAGNNYYRLKMFDIDGTVSHSSIIVVMNGTTGTLISSMMPTMVIDRARLNISSASKGNMQLVITDINGRIVQTQNASISAGNQEVWVNATRLATGYFQITGYINSEKTETIRFFKR